MPIRPLIGLLGVLLAAVSSDFNDQVTSIALEDIRGGLGISYDPGTWIDSLYVSAEIVGMATSPWFLVTFTLRRWTLFVIALNGLVTVLIPFSSHESVVQALRLAQGLTGGFTIPLLMTTALHVLPPPIRLYGLAVYALTATFTPGLADAMAALWTNVVGWEFIFFEAIPFCALSGVIVWSCMEQDEPDYGRFRLFDWRGLIGLIVGFGAFSTMLQQGDRLDWFNSDLICVLGILSVVAIPLFVVNEWFHPLPFLKMQMLGRRNFGYAVIALFSFLVITSSASTVPLQYLSQVGDFRPEQTYLVTLEISLLQFVMLPVMALVLDVAWIDSRVVSFLGLALIIASCIGSSFLTDLWWPDHFLLWQVLQAVGQPMVVMPLLMMATNTVKGPDEAPFASALVNTPRAIAEAVAPWLIALVTRWRGRLHDERIVDQLGQDRGLLGRLGDGATARQAVRDQVSILTTSDTYLVLAAVAVALIVVLLILPERTLPPRLQLAKH